MVKFDSVRTQADPDTFQPVLKIELTVQLQPILDSTVLRKQESLALEIGTEFLNQLKMNTPK